MMERMYPSSALGSVLEPLDRVEKVSHLTLGRAMVYKTRIFGKHQKSHIWTGSDTACTMWSTGGLKPEREWLETSTPPKEVCQMCKVKWSQANDLR